ncbi:SusD/RagB family nutrient-binding outer membrane lipoprotein [Lentimicrobium sp. L6]|uniref:SusD/RagB family nutrient-binding outer membrane lipoprotein n=1 Tax=Lentimicrobium sp. L6 TaxID=2735916 RepID=UPI00155241F7|nr:SusD/RagB family nutrient-binding outer membrane lipoprotein [Lentimicrobium sp. L6]NPD85053.1 SusD/RagB family nutrient-binding outer membrane lipoprotein [Lentimicrobium sp. L6]
MKRIYLILIVLVAISVSCTKNFEDWQKDEKHPAVVPGEMLFTHAQKALADQVASSNVNLNNHKLYAQHWTETTYTDEANYDLINRNIPDNVFRVIYRDILKDLQEARSIISGDATTTPEAQIAKTNRLIIIDVLEVYSYQRLVDIFGNVPYSEALNIDATLNPAYDDGMMIYKDLVVRLDKVINTLDANGGSFGSADIYYGGDVQSWITFAQSLKFRLAITIADADNATAQAWGEAAAAHTFSSSAQDAKLVYEAAPLDNTNPIYQDLVASGRKDFIPANTIVDFMNGLNDPRRAAYFDLNEVNEGEYVGGIYGSSNAWGNYSHVGTMILDATFPIQLLSFTEMEFYKAEAAARGWSVGGTALEHYEAAITASFAEWGIEGAADYIASEGVAWDGTTDWKKAIGMQAYLGYYQRGFEGWTTYRRLDWPTMNVPEGAITTDGGVPRRFTFPVNEQTLNADNYYKAADAVGGDLMETKLFWDKF